MDRTLRSTQRRGRILAITAVLGVAGMLLALAAGPAAAHERRRAGGYQLVVGFGDEPAFAGQKNSVEVLISDAAGKPVTDVGDNLNVMVMSGDQASEMKLEPNFAVGKFGTPGDYRAFFIPSAPGKYTFHIQGSIKGQRINQRFTSSPTTFSEVEDPARVTFPKSDQPSTGQIAQRLDRETTRLAAALQGAQAATQAAERRARDASSQVRTLGIIAAATTVLSVVGMTVLALTVGRLKRRTAIALRAARADAELARRPVEV